MIKPIIINKVEYPDYDYVLIKFQIDGEEFLLNAIHDKKNKVYNISKSDYYAMTKLLWNQLIFFPAGNEGIKLKIS